MKDPKVRMKELIQILEPAARAYYQENREIMDNREYDAYYDELVKLENETKTVLAGSPTMKVGYEIVSELPKEVHESRMLSLDKTKEVTQLQTFLGDHFLNSLCVQYDFFLSKTKFSLFPERRHRIGDNRQPFFSQQFLRVIAADAF